MSHQKVFLVVDAHEVVASGASTQGPGEEVGNQTLPLIGFQAPLGPGHGQSCHRQPSLPESECLSASTSWQ